MISNEFLDKKQKTRQKKSNDNYDETINKIINKYVTESFIEKEYAKIKADFIAQGKDYKDMAYRKEFIGRVLVGIYRTLLEEEIFNIVKQYKNPIIDFNRLRKAIENKIKETVPNLF